MPISFVSGCDSGSTRRININKKTGLRNCSLFHAPNLEMLAKWQEVLPPSDALLKKSDPICELHFNKDDIEREFVTKMPDGSTFRLKRAIPKLKAGAVPFIFQQNEDCIPSKRTKTVTENIAKIHRSDTSRTISDINCIELSEKERKAKITRDEFPKDMSVASIFSQEDLSLIHLPSSLWAANIVEGKMCFVEFEIGLLLIKRRIVLHEDLTLTAPISEKKKFHRELQSISNISEMSNMLIKFQQIRECLGVYENFRSTDCLVYAPHKKRVHFTERCLPCRRYRQYLNRRQNKSEENLRKAKLLQRNKIRRSNRMKAKINRLQNVVNDLKTKCSQANIEKVECAISEFPEGQQQAFRACLDASRLKNKKNVRYTTQWMYDCILLRIKSKKAYEHLRNHNILHLPSIKTINKYIFKIKGAYGFQKNVFELIKLKSSVMAPDDRRGILLVDEMQLSTTLSFNRRSLEIQGFTNLGKHTPLHQKNKKEDHALVIMFQPFKGNWVQALACFLSKGCAAGTVLHHLLVEATILVENAGLFVDGISCDGTTWNRSMWYKFGICEESPRCEHILDGKRSQWFFSDFPHLIKNLRNFLIKTSETWTSDGILKLKYWDALLEIEDQFGFNLKANYKLTEDHIRPKKFQKMNVALAFQFFGIADALELYKEEGCFNGSDGTIKFCRRIKSLITAMNTRTPIGALKIRNEEWKIIQEFVEYLEIWEKKALSMGYNFLTKSTAHGLKVTLKATLEICQYLIEKCNFSFLMTARLNQDALERFFGMMRIACGSNDHPDSTLFIQMYKLISTYSLVKPPKGSNVSGGEILEVLCSVRIWMIMKRRKCNEKHN